MTGCWLAVGWQIFPYSWRREIKKSFGAVGLGTEGHAPQKNTKKATFSLFFV